MSREDQSPGIWPSSNGCSGLSSLPAADGGRLSVLLVAEVGRWMGRTRSLQLVLLPHRMLSLSFKNLISWEDLGLVLFCGPDTFLSIHAHKWSAGLASRDDHFPRNAEQRIIESKMAAGETVSAPFREVLPKTGLLHTQEAPELVRSNRRLCLNVWPSL